jgi:predicted ester cyclase
MEKELALAELRRDVTPAEYDEIRALWKAHSLAEDGRSIPGLLATLTPDCVYEVVATGHRWEGHAGAARFYQELLTAFPDVEFHLQHIVIGPQGVYEEAVLEATHRADYLGFPATGRRVRFTVLIHFPWDPARRKFTGERVHVDLSTALSGGAGRA